MSQFRQAPQAPRYRAEQAFSQAVAYAPAETRAEFIRKTYVHLVGAVLAFVALEGLFFGLVPLEMQSKIALTLIGGWMWLLVIGLFMVVAYVADRFARSPASRPLQYTGLAMYVLVEAAIFVPILFIAKEYAPDNTIASAALITVIIFAALTAYVFVTRADFSWLGGILWIAGGAALAIIVAGLIFGFHFGLWFIIPVILLACGYILYHTSALLHQYQPGQHVAASLALFASVALLFYYILMLLLRLQDE